MLVERNSFVYIFKATQVCCQCSLHLRSSFADCSARLRLRVETLESAPSDHACSGGPVTGE